MPISDRIRRKVDNSQDSPIGDASFLDITASENLFLLDLARHYRNRLLTEGNLNEIAEFPAKILRAKIESLVSGMMKEEGQSLPPIERSTLIAYLISETVGLGPLERLRSDPTITEIMVNAPSEIYVERNGKIVRRPDVQFKDEAHILHIIDRIISPLGRRIDESSPMVDARLPDGSRVNAAIEPVSLNGPVLTIRKFRKEPFTVQTLLDSGTLSDDMADFLKACVVAKQNVVVSGGTGSGKTTTLNVLASFVPRDERVVTIEDAAELQFHLTHPHVLRMESRPPNVEGQGEITIRQLVRNALRMRPDRIIVGEVRGAEALDMLQAMNTGHEGSLTTIHANSTRDAFSRLETMVMWAEGTKELPLSAIREHLVGAINIVVQQERLTDGTRKITAISEVQGLKKGLIVVRDIFVFDRTGIDEMTGRVQGSFTSTGNRPRCLVRIKASGIRLPDSIFQPKYLVAEMGEELLEAEEVTEIMVNSPNEVFVERHGKLGRAEKIHFRDENHLLNVINTIVAPIGRRVDETTPIVDARLPDGSRVNAVLPPVALGSPVLTIRRFPKDPLKLEDLLANNTLTSEMASFLEVCVKSKLNLLISGGTGSGKTTTLNILSGFIPPDERIVTIEDVVELQLKRADVVRLEARPPDEYGEGEINIRALVRNALRMRPNRIIVGEVRGGEALDMLQAMNTGHEGSMTTVHANTPADAFARLETMVMWAGTQLPSSSIREQLVGAINIVVQQNRLTDGSRKVVAISEIQDTKGGVIDLKDIFVFKQEGVGAEQQVIGRFETTGVIPKALSRFRQFGISTSPKAFAAGILKSPNDSGGS